MTQDIGIKYDLNKPRFDLIDAEYELALARVLTMGAAKYGPDNWQDLEDAEHRYLAACRRHLNKYSRGERLDRESNQSHLAHAACNIMFLLWKENQKDEVTDIQRHPSDYSTVDQQPRTNGPSCDEPVNEHRAGIAEDVLKEIIKILNQGWTHKFARARIHDLLDSRGFTILAGTVNSPSNE